jgi:hypothetical protein
MPPISFVFSLIDGGVILILLSSEKDQKKAEKSGKKCEKKNKIMPCMAFYTVSMSPGCSFNG